MANPTWNKEYDNAKKESINENKNFYKGFGFSDQCYLIKTSDFKQCIYNEENILTERYPTYGGNLFEKRIDAWMRNNNYNRITFKHDSYYHKNYPKTINKKIFRYIEEKFIKINIR